MLRSGAFRLNSLPERIAEFIEPMECALVTKLPEGSDWTYEVKLDGYRAIGVKTSRDTILYSRNGKNFNKRYPHITEAISALPADTVIDGEIVPGRLWTPRLSRSPALPSLGHTDSFFRLRCAYLEWARCDDGPLERTPRVLEVSSQAAFTDSGLRAI